MSLTTFNAAVKVKLYPQWSKPHQLQFSPYTDSPGDPRAPQEHRSWWLHPVPPVECPWRLWLSVSPSDNQALDCQLLHQSYCLSSWKSVLFPRYFYWQHRQRILCTSKLHHRRWLVNSIYLQCQAFSNIEEIKEKFSVQAYKTQVNFTFEFIQTADTDRGQFLTCTNCEVEPAGLGVPDLVPGLTPGESQCWWTFGQNSVVIYPPPTLLTHSLA